MSLTRYVLIGVVPFNLIKGIVVSVAFFAIAKALAPWLARREIQPSH
jgi:riboflavin transporter FmnP